MLRELSFYDKLYIVKTSKVYKGYRCSYNVEIIDSNKRPTSSIVN